MITIKTYKYRKDKIDDLEELLYELTQGLMHCESIDADFRFRIDQDEDYIEIKTIRLNESVN